MKKAILFLAAGLLLASCCGKPSGEYTFEDVPFSVIPNPSSVNLGEGFFEITGADFYVDEALGAEGMQVARDFAARLRKTTGYRNAVRKGKPDGFGAGVRFIKGDAAESEDAYALHIGEDGIVVAAAARRGLLDVVYTLEQMLPASFFAAGTRGQRYRLQYADIADSPRFSYRGVLIDVGRHFFPVDEIKKCLDVMAIYKVNRFHWHLSEDQGWRIEIKKYPRLTQVGSIRKATQIAHWRDTLDNKEYKGYYTQKQIREVVAYADRLGITVIPEIDLPGHMLSALTAYPELGCTGGPYEVACTWGVKKDVLCAGQEKTFEFLEDVLTEIMELFPSEYINIGGDECPKDRWKECPRCQARIAELGFTDHDGHTAEQYLQSYVTNRMQKFLLEHGRKIIGWEEILEGDLAPGATIMSWRGVEPGIKAAARGFDAIMSPGYYMYIDRYNSEEWDREPVSIGACLPTELVYSYEPCEGVAEDAKQHIIGVQANLWTEFIGSPDYLEYMLVPRLAALSEVQWEAEGARDWERFRAALDHSAEIYKAMGLTYCKYPWGIVGMPGYEQPARTPEEIEAYLQVRRGPWEMKHDEVDKLIIK
ncbi:MAG: beta-N-acetylhexosaminidase [Bacteroidales bacterium]|nr:beta-N-acetylhexosaminidase [Bacteroidales bacterium]